MAQEMMANVAKGVKTSEGQITSRDDTPQNLSPNTKLHSKSPLQRIEEGARKRTKLLVGIGVVVLGYYLYKKMQ
jgi:hypothetical protein